MSKSKKEYFVRDLIIDDEYGIIDSNASIQDAAKKMKELGVPDLVVVEKESNKILGVVADFDIVQNVVAEGIDPKSAKVISAMYTITSVSLDTPVFEAFTRMRDLQVNVVPVVEKEKLIGVCTIQDCWDYIPDVSEDDIGLIPVADPKNAEFWFTSVCSILAFVLGILLPLVGVFGYFSANQTDLMNFFGMAEIRGGEITFYLFEARGTDFFFPLSNLIARNGFIWAILVTCSFSILIIGIIGLFSLIYTSFSDARNIKTGRIVRTVIPWLIIVFMILEWVFFIIGFMTAAPPVNVLIDGIGLFMSITSILLFLLAINRNYLFRQKGISKSSTVEVSV